MENKYGITERWTTADCDYSDARAAHLKEKLQQLKTSMWAVAARREYLLRMKAKYAGMSVLCAYVMCLAKALNSWYRWSKDSQEIEQRYFQGDKQSKTAPG